VPPFALDPELGGGGRSSGCSPLLNWLWVERDLRENAGKLINK